MVAMAIAETVDLWAVWRAAHDEVTARRLVWDEARATCDWAAARAAFADLREALVARGEALAALRLSPDYTDEQRRAVVAALSAEASRWGVPAGQEVAF